MRVTYTIEQKRKAVQTYKKPGAFTKTIRKLGYPSNHVLCEWVRDGIKTRKPRKPDAPSKRYDWRLKHEAVSRVLSGENVKDTAEALKVTNCATVYEWARCLRERDDRPHGQRRADRGRRLRDPRATRKVASR